MSISHLLVPQAQRMTTSLVRELLHYSQHADILSLAGGLPDERYMPDFPALDEIADSRQYGPSEGEMPLRRQVAAIVCERGIEVTANNVLITNGSQQGLDIISRLILDSESIIITEQPTYLAACQVFNMQGAKIKDVAADKYGMSVEALRDAIEVYNPKAVYLIPNFQNPAGHCYSLKRRQEIAALLDEKNVLLIEDDPYRDLCYEEVDLTPITSFLTKAPWLYMGSFSKILWPGVRTGYIASCEAFFPFLVKVKQACDLHTNRLGQNIIASFLSSDDFPKHKATLQRVYKEKRNVMSDALTKYLSGHVEFNVPSGGMFFWVKLPDGVSSKQVMQEALLEKVLVLPGTPFFPTPNVIDDAYLRLSFARVSPEDLDKAIYTLSKVIKQQLA